MRMRTWNTPGLTEAVEKQDWKLAGQQAALLEKAVKKNTKLLRDALAGLKLRESGVK